MKRLFPLLTLILLAACTTVDLYEKSATIPNHAWDSSFKPNFEFTISDTSVPYQVYLVLRHTDKYKYNNIYLNLYIKGPGKDSAVKLKSDLSLATNEGWRGEAMDDIYEQRILIGKLGENQPLQAGNYTFTLEQIMRDNPLAEVLSAGVRVEKK